MQKWGLTPSEWVRVVVRVRVGVRVRVRLRMQCKSGGPLQVSELALGMCLRLGLE